MAGPDAAVVDLGGRVVVPGFIDAHTHLVMMGEALGKVGLTDARTLPEIQDRLRAARDADPDAPRLLGRGWLFDSVPGGAPTAAMLDAVVADVPVYLDANDYHSVLGQHGRAARARHRPGHPRSHRRAHRTRRRRRARRHALRDRRAAARVDAARRGRHRRRPRRRRRAHDRGLPRDGRHGRGRHGVRRARPRGVRPRRRAPRRHAADPGARALVHREHRRRRPRTSPRSPAPWSSPASTARGSRSPASSSCSTA